MSKLGGTICGGDITLSIVIPAYNEAENIREAMEMITAGLTAAETSCEIIIVDDGSGDRTGDIVQEFARKDDRIRMLRHENNRGKGASLITGFRNARMEWVLFTDADLQVAISELWDFIPYTGNFDLVAGFRMGRRDSLLRRILSKAYTCIIFLLLGVRFQDLNCPFKLIRKSLLDDIELHANGFFIDTELIHDALLRNCHIKELPVACQSRQRGRSTVRFRHVLETVRELIALMRRDRLSNAFKESEKR